MSGDRKCIDEKQFSDVKNKIYHAFQILQETNLLEPQAEELLKQRDRIKKRIGCDTKRYVSKRHAFGSGAECMERGFICMEQIEYRAYS